MADSLVAGGGRDSTRASVGNISKISHRAGWAMSGLAMVLVLLAPAIWNGFPLIFPDTGGYLIAAMSGTPMHGRSAFYGLFLSAGIPFAFWPCIILQSALMAWLFAVTLRVNGLGGRPWLAFAIVAFTTITTSLPWLTGQLMPDILFAAAALALYLLAYAHDLLARWERLLLATVIAIAIPSHMAAAGLCVGVGRRALAARSHQATHPAGTAPGPRRLRHRRRHRAVPAVKSGADRPFRFHARWIELPVRTPDRRRHDRPISGR